MKTPTPLFSWLGAALLAFLPTCWADTKVVLPDPDLFADAQDKFFATTTIPGDFTTLETLVPALLNQADAAKNKKLTRPFVPKMLESTSQFQGAKPLSAYYKGVQQKGKQVILSFDSEAMRYLNSTSAIQSFVKGAIEETIQLNFPDVKEVLYEVDGKIVKEWDA